MIEGALYPVTQALEGDNYQVVIDLKPSFYQYTFLSTNLPPPFPSFGAVNYNYICEEYLDSSFCFLIGCFNLEPREFYIRIISLYCK